VPALALVAACRPSSVAEAEAKGDVSWLESNGSGDAVAALGRLADDQPKALEALQKRASFDTNAFIAAWVATKRGQPWGPALLRRGLIDPNRAEPAASAMARRDPLLSGFVVDIENAMARLAAGASGASLGSLLASVGPPAHAAVERRLKDGASRRAMCSGIAAPDASQDARNTLLAVPASSRDDAACVTAVVAFTAADDAPTPWLATNAEPGLLSSVAKSTDVPCARLHTLWAKALVERPPGVYSALTVPLSFSIKRCPDAMDGVLGDAIQRVPAVRATIVNAVDPFGGETSQLKVTCEALPIVTRGSDAGIVSERANDALQHGCRGLL
jgi:hypothetical protein